MKNGNRFSEVAMLNLFQHPTQLWKGSRIRFGMTMIVIFLITSLFFYPIFKGNVPFPGDLLVGNSGPYNTQSYDGYAPGGVPHKAQGSDVLRQLYPWKYFVIESFKHGAL